ncbi:MAG: S8 family serine peptidase [Bacteroidetes bacterium]|nr:S8 family serine peptidase [Bacteroidota bacterium]
MITKPIRIRLFYTFLFLSALFTVHAQQQPGAAFRFKGGVYRPERNITSFQQGRDALRTAQDSLRPSLYRKKYYVLLQFDKLPDSVQKLEMERAGIRLFDYLPDRAYLAEIRDSAATLELPRYSVSGIYRMPSAYKISPRLQQHTQEDLNDADKVIAINYFGSLSEEEVKEDIRATGAVIVPEKIQPPHVLFVRVGNAAVLQRLTALPYISYMASQPMKAKSLNYHNRGAHGASALGATSGRNLQGDGVAVGVGDDSSPYTHIDFTGRLIDRFSSTVNVHGTHVSGSIGGAGFRNASTTGMAPHSTIISQYFSDIVTNSPYYYNDYGMQLTSNSYTFYDFGCQYDGEYDALSYYTDNQLFFNPRLMHLFASGNDGGIPACSPYPQTFTTVKSGFQSSKNAIDVGNIDNTIEGVSPLGAGSSAGPVNDGRIKPEIVAGGSAVVSTAPYNTYAQEWGTSMACPTAAGTMALMVQRYRQKFGANPYGIVMKALVCNTANDMGNPGPDYLYGFGAVNGRAAVECIENSQFFVSTIANGSTTTGTLTVPSGTQQVRIMLYWNDYPATPFAASTLVDNLDLTVTDASGVVHHPLILNPNAANVNDPAVEGVDNVNNIEQVVVNVPTGGTFNISIKGTSVPVGSPLPYVLTWQFIQPSVVVEYPFGNETIRPAVTEILRWNAYGGEPNPFKAEYSLDNGSTWTLIQDDIPSNYRSLNWTPPNIPTNQGLIRITRKNTAYSDVSDYPFIVLDATTVTPTNVCPGYSQLTWDAIPSATSYDVMQLIGTTMQKIGNTTSTNYLVSGLNPGGNYWFAVQAVMGSIAGRRSDAVNVTPSSGPCTLSAMDNDYTVDSLIGLQSGRLSTSSQLGNSVPIQIELKNLGSVATSSSFNLSYSINGGTPVTEASSAVLAAHSSLNYTFSAHADLSAAGTDTIRAWVDYPGDPLHTNDTIVTVVRQLTNAAITLNPTYTEGFEAAASATYGSPTMGFTGLDRADFYSNNANGRARTFVNTGFARTGTRCITLDQVHTAATTSADSLITTFNLSSYSSSDQIWLDFYYKNHGNDSVRTANKVWIRGSDQDLWIPVYTLDTSINNIGVYQPSAHIDVTGTLRGVVPSQTVSSSFQVKFGEEGYTSATNVIPDGSTDDGYSFDDITLTRSMNDVGIAALVDPSPGSFCSLSTSQTISFKVKNYGNSTATNIPVSFTINGTRVSEVIPSINSKDSVIYTFTQHVNMSGFGNYAVSGSVKMGGDTYTANDSLLPVTIHTSPLISTYPYLEGFESNDGYWYPGGLNSSWQWGVPNSGNTIINKAANGTHSWVTNLNGNYNDNEQSYLYSPCFDLSGLANPVLSFSHIFRTEDGCDCDYHWVEYSTDGVTWAKLGGTGSGVNWYDNAIRQAWQVSDAKWHVSSFDIPTHGATVKFRIAMKSDMATNYEGVGIDDIHVFDKAAVYTGGDITSGLSQSVSGNGWVNFDVSGHRIASINPNGQDLGLTSVKIYNNTGPVRNDGLQYYLDRNIVIQPSNALSSPVSVRFYFLDVEARGLINASGCTACTTISDAYQAGVSQYSSPVSSEEDGDLTNDNSGTWLFHPSHTETSVVPYDNGYYAEYQVGGFSEFWINNGGPTNAIPLPLNLLFFTAVKSGDNGLLQWSTTGEKNVRRFIIQKSSDGSRWTDQDSVPAAADSGNVHFYRWTDTRLFPGVNYYRLRMQDIDGHSTFSPVKTLDVDGTIRISVYPNPVESRGTLYVTSTVNCRLLRLTEMSGKILVEKKVQGFQSTLSVGMLSRGIYLLVVDTDTGAKVQKVFIK